MTDIICSVTKDQRFYFSAILIICSTEALILAEYCMGLKGSPCYLNANVLHYTDIHDYWTCSFFVK